MMFYMKKYLLYPVMCDVQNAFKLGKKAGKVWMYNPSLLHSFS